MQAIRILFLLLLVVLVPSVTAHPTSAANCGGTSTGFTPLTDLGAGTYRGLSGGLYPAGSASPPPDYLQAGLSASQHIARLDRLGRPDPNGRIVLLSIGMSNASAEFSAFIGLARADGRTNPGLLMVDGAQGGWDAAEVSDPAAPYWATVDQRLSAVGAGPAQVQVAWLKEVVAEETGAFPADAQRLQGYLRSITQIMQQRFPNLRIVYLASRTYGGYATTTLSPEPFAYESGFAVKWVIEERIAGQAAGAWLGWGPYLWTDGTNGRGDGLTWTCQDVVADGTHPSASGQRKVATLLLRFFQTDPTARAWFLAGPGGPTPTPTPTRAAPPTPTATPSPTARATPTPTSAAAPSPTPTPNPLAPSIDGFTPSSGPAGTIVTITGRNFGGTRTVRFNGAGATFVVDSPDTIRAQVPSGATSGPIGVGTPAGIGLSSGNFVLQ